MDQLRAQFRAMLMRITGTMRSPRHRDEFQDELASHIAMHTDDGIRAGLSPEEARREALIRLGGAEQTRQACRERNTLPRLESVIQDLRFAFRQLGRTPGFTLTVILMLALGVGANTAVFSIVDAVLLRPLPYIQPQRLVQVESADDHEHTTSNVSYPDFFDWRARNRSFDHLVSYHDMSSALTGGARAIHLDGEIVSWDLLPMLGISPELGRGFISEEEKKGTHVVLISHSLWESQFGADKSIIGRAIHLGGIAYSVIGVMPASFRFPVEEPHVSFWTTPAIDEDNLANRGSHFLSVMGRLKNGATSEQAEQDMQSVAAQLTRAYPNTNTRHNSIHVEMELQALLGDTRTLLLVVLGAVALVLLIACGNIANLQLARVRDRQMEIAMRTALGANRSRVVRQLMTESLLLCIAGGATGCAVAFAAVPGLLNLIGDSVPRAADAAIDLRVLSFALLASLSSAMLFGLFPAVTASKTDLISILQKNGQSKIFGHDWLRSAVTVAQVALGIILTAGAGLLMTSFNKLTHTDEGFNTSNLLTFNFETPDSNYKDTRPQFYRRYFEQLRALPGVQSAGGSMLLPMTDDDISVSFENPERPVPEGRRPGAELAPVSTDYFQTLQVPFIAGRDFSDADDMNAPRVMIVNQAFALQFFPGEDPIGKKLRPGARDGSPGGPPWRTIVGVVGNVRHSAEQRDFLPAMYLPASQLPNWCCLRTVVRTSVDPLALEPAARRLVASMDSDIPVTDVRTMRELLSLQLAQPRFAMVLLGAFAALALSLTVVGLYGVMTYSVSCRTREIGLRLALGAQRTMVLKMVLRDAVLLLCPGIVIGISGALLSGPVLAKLLYGTGPRNAFVLTAVTAGVALAGVLAAYFPARRAASIDPMQALRTQ